MYVRVISFQPTKEAGPAEAEAVYEELMEVLRTLDGFCGCSLLLNQETRRGMSMSYWRDREAADQAASVSLPILLDRVGNLVEAPPEISGYELLDHQMTGG